MRNILKVLLLLGVICVCIQFIISILAVQSKESKSSQQEWKKPSVMLVILVHSKAQSFSRRNAIRESWARKRIVPRHWKTVFVLGKDSNQTINDKVNEEASQYGDIVVFPVSENYPNFTTKVLSSFKWCLTRYNFQYILKTNDNVFVNVEALMKFLQDRLSKRRLFMGSALGNVPVNRDRSNEKYYLPRKVYKEAVFPVFLSGTGYVLSHDVVRSLVRIVESKPKDLVYFAIEDVFIAYVVRKLGYRTYHNSRFSLERSCDRRDLILMNDVESFEQMKMFHRSRNEEPLC